MKLYLTLEDEKEPLIKVERVIYVPEEYNPVAYHSLVDEMVESLRDIKNF